MDNLCGGDDVFIKPVKYLVVYKTTPVNTLLPHFLSHH